MVRPICAILTLILVAPSCWPQEDRYYSVESYTIPRDIALEVGALELFQGRLIIATRRGDLYELQDFEAKDIRQATLRLVFRGLHEPLGLLSTPEGLYAIQRGELSRLNDRDGDGIFDALVTVCDSWSLSGNYHEYNFGPVLDPLGDGFWITTNKPFGNEPFGRAPFRGFALRITKDGAMIPECAGLRSPAGIEASPTGELFYTDNQGEWCGASKLSHLIPGEYHGHPHGNFSCVLPEWRHPKPPAIPSGIPMPEAARRFPPFKLPAVWFPYDKMGKSPCGFRFDTTGGLFGPFEGQVFVADQHHAAVLRLSLEQIDGHWQGACYPFREGLSCGATRLLFTKAGSLIVGQSDRGWASKGTQPFGLQRLRSTGIVPFEILRMEATPEGFRVHFTQPIQAGVHAKAFRMESYTYVLSENYGSPEIDRKTLTIAAVLEQEDRRSVHILVPDRRAGYVHELRAEGVRSLEGIPLLHPDAYYTLVNIPGGESIHPKRARTPEVQEEANIPWIPLFDGLTTEGWNSTWSEGKVEIKDAEIHLTSPKGMFFLASQEVFADFILEAEVRIPAQGNSGIQFRSQVDGQRMRGYQAEVDPTPRRWAGGLYDQNRRAWLHPLTGDERAMAAYREGEWNHYRIECRGHHIRITLNGVVTTDTYDPMDLSGRIGLQHHGEAGLTYRFRRVRIKRLGEHERTTVALSGGKAQEESTATPKESDGLQLAAVDAPIRKRWEIEVLHAEEPTFRIPYRLSSGQLILSVREESSEQEIEILRINKDGALIQEPEKLPEHVKALLKKSPYDSTKLHTCDLILRQSEFHIFLDGIVCAAPIDATTKSKGLRLVLDVNLEKGGRLDLSPVQKLRRKATQVK